ncbi:unnamed protein product [Prorocentrum cordatum]|uniref:Uncharacterized protein n=1 Tax=Prorocentrum cordatum TaxID=2364126 RepID=A0ABN9XDG2_9DINO|nr:unnamed protein product [Polarella glacialis]|mmetsp:Transcript_97415/g.264519  ORF Transcript_97415/g.264519 Transcript_97415/m.264519 type:complete len:198 (-) Transcript_97415:82-675(-)
MLVPEAELVPTDHALRMRPVFIFSLSALFTLVIGKLIIRDIWGAISVFFVVLMGLFVLSGEYRVNASSACFFSVVAMISAVFDVVSCVSYFQHSKYRMMDPRAPELALLAQVVFLVSPMLLAGSSAVGYSIWSDCRDSSQEFGAGLGPFPDYGSALGLGAGAGGASLPTGPAQRSSSAAPLPVVPFTGHGHRLDRGE